MRASAPIVTERSETLAPDAGSHSLNRLVVPFYADDYCTIYHGDNQELLALMPTCDLMLTDPPYGNGYAADTIGHKHSHSWDSETPPQWMLDLARHKGRTQIIWGGNHYTLPPTRCVLSWYKPDAPPSMGNCEYAWTNLDRNSRQISHTIAATNGERIGHPTQKPLRVIAWSMEQAGDWQTVLDPWMGSGTTLLAAKQRNKRAIGIEREKRWCEIAVKRLKQEQLALGHNAEVSHE